MNPLLKYTLARFGLFVVSFAVVGLVVFLWLEVSQPTVLFVAVVSLVLSSIGSLIFLRPMREKVVDRMQERAARMTQRIEESRNAEDVD